MSKCLGCGKNNTLKYCRMCGKTEYCFKCVGVGCKVCFRTVCKKCVCIHADLIE